MTKYLQAKKLILKAASNVDKEEKTSEVLFNVYRKEMEAIIDSIIPLIAANKKADPVVMSYLQQPSYCLAIKIRLY